MAEVYRVRDLGLQCDAALKIMRIPTTLASTPEQWQAFVRQFLDEMRIHASVNDITGVVPIKASGVYDNTYPYMVLEYVQGASLSERMRECLPDSRDIVGWIDSFARTLDALHERSVYHLDIKPSNLMVDSRKIIDFGISRIASRLGPVESELARALATPEYASPEQALSKQRVDGKSDQYSLAVVAFEMIAGQRPCYDSDTLRLQEKIIRGELRALSEANPRLKTTAWLESVFRKALHTDPTRRFKSCAAFARSLKYALLWYPWVSRLGFALIAIGAVAAGLLFLRRDPPSPPVRIVESDKPVKPDSPLTVCNESSSVVDIVSLLVVYHRGDEVLTFFKPPSINEILIQPMTTQALNWGEWNGMGAYYGLVYKEGGAKDRLFSRSGALSSSCVPLPLN